MNNFEGGPVELPPDMEEVISEELTNFQNKIKELRDNPDTSNENLKRVDPATLTEADLAIYEKLNKLLAQPVVSKEEVEAFYEEVLNHQFEARTGSESRGYFSGHIANQSMALLRKSGY